MSASSWQRINRKQDLRELPVWYMLDSVKRFNFEHVLTWPSASASVKLLSLNRSTGTWTFNEANVNSAIQIATKLSGMFSYRPIQISDKYTYLKIGPLRIFPQLRCQLNHNLLVRDDELSGN